VRAYLRDDGLAPYSGGKYGSTGKVLGYLGGAGDSGYDSGSGPYYVNGVYTDQHTSGHIFTNTDSYTAPLECFGKIRDFLMSNVSSDVYYADKTSVGYSEYVINIISPETEFDLINFPNSIKLEVRDKLYFSTLDKRHGESLFTIVDHTLGDIDYSISDIGTGGFIRNDTNAKGSSYRHFRVDEDKKCHVLIAYPDKSEE